MKRDKYIALLAAVSVALSGCQSADAPVTTTEMSETVSTTSAAPETSENTEISESNAAPIKKHDLSDIELGEERVWINKAQEYEDIISKLGLDKKKQNIIKGVYLAATDDDILYFYAYDEYEIDGKTKLGAYSTFEIASATKTFTATAVLQLIERGELSLDDTLGKFFPDYEKGRDITIYQLLHMQAGIYDHINEPEYFYGRGDMETVKKVFFDKLSDEDFLQALYSADLKYEPGTKQSYCNTAYHLLAMIIEQVTGMSYADYIQKNIFDVCGMEHSSSMKIGDLTTVTSAEGKISEITDNGYSVSPNTDRGDGDIHTCAADLLAFDRELKNGRLINEKSLAEMFNMDMGYGCGMMQISPKIYGHDGNNPGYKTVNQFIETDSGNIYIIKLTHY
ncbi:MAG: beta-lactamase family protein [Oscillospiraceae bacterium]|nr:beta-lactamase family protein [Oscillospiraceae bacterium]